MKKRSTLFYVFVSFLLFSIYVIFLPNLLSSPLSIILLAIIFRFVLGVYWKKCFLLAIINYVWILMLSGVSIAAEFIMIIQGQGTSGKGLSLAFFLIIIGVPLTLITLNWTSNRRLPYSAFDKLLSQFFRQKKRPFKRKRYNHKQKRKRKKKW